MRTSTKAFTLIELLVGISIAGILVVISFPAIKTLSQAQRQLQTHQAASLAVDSAHKEIALSLNQAQTLNFLTSTIIEQAEAISQNSKFVYYLRNHPAKGGSTIISFLHPLPEYGGKIISATAKTITFCFPTLPSDFHGDLSDFSWLLLSLSGQSYRGGNAHFINAQDCASKKAVLVNLQILPIDLFSSPTSFPNEFIYLAAIPVAHSYSIYLDNENILRKVYHQSGQNQPLLKSIDSIIINSSQIDSRTTSINVQITSSLKENLEEEISKRIYLLTRHQQKLLDFLL